LTGTGSRRADVHTRYRRPPPGTAPWAQAAR
jgi:hypothetical protein